MPEIKKKIKDWIVKIQNSNESVKRKYLLIATAVTMVVIVGLWLIYIKITSQSIIPINQPQIDQSSQTQFWQVFKNGLNIVGGSLKQNFQNIFSHIYKGNTINIK